MLQQPASPIVEDFLQPEPPAFRPAWNKPVETRCRRPHPPAGTRAARRIPDHRHQPLPALRHRLRGFVDLLAGQIAAALGNARAYEAERRRAEALAEIDRAKTTFFSNVSHELRTPLTLMLSPVEELLAAGRRKHAAGARTARSGSPQRPAPPETSQTLCSISRASKPAACRPSMSPPTSAASPRSRLELPLRHGARRLDLQNRVRNVRRTGLCRPRDVGENRSQSYLERPEIHPARNRNRVAESRPDGHAVLTVEDTGTGIPAEELPHIFERFHRVEGSKGRTIEGTGIGLALVEELVKLHGGSIHVASELNAGSTFTVSLPLGAAHLSKDRIRPGTDRVSTGSRPNILSKKPCAP